MLNVKEHWSATKEYFAQFFTTDEGDSQYVNPVGVVFAINLWVT